MKYVVGTLFQYLLDGDTCHIRNQCSVLEVLQRIIKFFTKTLTAEFLILEKKKKTKKQKPQLSIMQETYVYCEIRYEA